MPILTESLAHMATAASALPTDSDAFAGLSDDELTALPGQVASVMTRLQSFGAGAAGEIADRSNRELGYAGLAQKSGFRTAEKLVQHLTGSTGREATKLVRSGRMLREAESIEVAERTGVVPPELTIPWLAAVGRAVGAGMLSLDAAEAIRLGLGTPNDDIPACKLAEAATRLVEEAVGRDGKDAAGFGVVGLDADELLIRARVLRDELDEVGITDREAARYEARTFRRYRRPDGMTCYTLLADPENAALVDDVYDALTSPRRGGPRMVDESAKTRQETIETDPRSTDQLAFDGFMAVLRIGADTDSTTAARSVLGVRRPAVRVLVTQTALNNGVGHGRVEGQDLPISLRTVERLVCETGTIGVMFDSDDQCMNLGREQRPFTPRQRIGLAARDGGCRWPGCDRPPSWTEAHHINPWKRDHGQTDVADGILLCKHHHLLLHNNGWEINRTGGEYWLVPPATVDPVQKPRPMPPKSQAFADLKRENEPRQPGIGGSAVTA